jgi:hypothetical protein
MLQEQDAVRIFAKTITDGFACALLLSLETAAGMNLSHAFAVLFILAVPAIGEAGDWRYADWRYSMGVHDFSVPDVDSHTYGVNGSVYADQRTDTGQHFFGSFELFVDHDKDRLDSDHIPIWWHAHVGTDGDFWHERQLRFGWTADINNRANTVSSIEQQITALPAIVGGYDGKFVQASLQAGAGWFYLEIDDDAPREQGYDRNALPNTTLAYGVTGSAKLKLGESWTISGWARRWWDSHQTLESQYKVELRGDASRWLDGRSWVGGHSMKNTQLVFSADLYQYNLNVYNRPNALPILRWDDDALYKLSIETDW